MIHLLEKSKTLCWHSERERDCVRENESNMPILAVSILTNLFYFGNYTLRTLVKEKLKKKTSCAVRSDLGMKQK